MGHLTDARAAFRAVLAQMQQDWPGPGTLDIELDGRSTIDQKRTTAYLKAEMATMGGGQADLNESPLVEQRGQILLVAVVPCGQGATPADTMLDFVLPYFDGKDLGPIRCKYGAAHGPKEIKGWDHWSLIYDYWYHRTTG